jgi:hypothetical protein
MGSRLARVFVRRRLSARFAAGTSSARRAGPPRALCTALLAAVATGQNASQMGPEGPSDPETIATVYRDENGMPHIVAETERAAWYALGYEQARDGLLFIQYACKAAKGELTWLRGLPGVNNDMAVKVFKAHDRLAGMSTSALRTLFAPTNPAIEANFYDLCVAFAAGANAYREEVKNAPTTPSTPESRLRDWLDNHTIPSVPQNTGQSSLAWVYEHSIEPVDIAAQGAYSAALMSFWWPDPLRNSAGQSFGDVPAGGGPADVAREVPKDPLAPGVVFPCLIDMRELVSSAVGAPSAFSGSNTFAWSRLYCQDAAPGTTTYAGLLGDPHQPVPAGPNFVNGFTASPNHLWFAHVQVTPQGATEPTLDVLGHFPHAAATSFTSHNRHVAMGGTLGAPNTFDTFLLRLQEESGGTGAAAENPAYFYSYYHDGSNSNVAWQQVTADTASIKLGAAFNNATKAVTYWRAQSFGVILPTVDNVLEQLANGQPKFPVVYGERVEPNQPAPRWRVGVPADPERMRFWGDPQFDDSQPPQLLTSPMLVALRAPIDQAVSGDDMHWQLLRDFWEMAHATEIADVIPRTNGAAFLANVCFVDRVGRTFSTQLSAIPQRGDNGQLYADGYRTLDKWAIYSKAYGPVPARHSDDRKFDWRFGGYNTPSKPEPLLVLPYSTTNPPTAAFKPMTLQDQAGNGAFPPTSYPQTGPFRIEGGFFASACNDLIWGYSRKRDLMAFLPDVDSGAFNNVGVDNQLFQWALDAGVVYQSMVLGLEAPGTQQIVVSRFTRQAERIIRGAPAGLPPLTPAQMREFVLTPEQYRDDSYVPPTGVTAHPELPAPIRQLQEVVDHPSYSASIGSPPVLYESPVVTAEKELAFFTDLWAELFNPQSPWASHDVAGASTTIILSLRELWIEGAARGYSALTDKIFWYDDPTNSSNPGLRWIELPHEFPLIDFYWPASEISRGVTAETLSASIWQSGEDSRFANLVSELVNWDPAGAHYHSVPSSPGACLLEMMRMGYNAKTESSVLDYGRHWVRLKRGQAYYGPLTGWVSLSSVGDLPGGAVRNNMPWSALRDLAFPGSQLATLFRGTGVHVPYDALYDNPANRSVRANLEPSHTNALVEFFLRLGNHYIEPQANNGNPSRKLARYQLLPSQSREDDFVALLPGRYPLTDGLQRLTAVRALLDTGAYLQPTPSSPVPTLGDHFCARAYGPEGQLWPAASTPPAPDAPCVGGSLRAVAWHEDGTASAHVPSQGFQPKFLGLGGSIASMLALFPSTGSGVQSYYWSTPGLEIMASDPSRFDSHMNAFATNTLLETHYDDFLSHVVWSVVHSY